MATYNQTSFPVNAMQFNGSNAQAIADSMPGISVAQNVVEGVEKSEVFIYGVFPVPVNHWVILDWQNNVFSLSNEAFTAMFTYVGGGEN